MPLLLNGAGKNARECFPLYPDTGDRIQGAINAQGNIQPTPCPSREADQLTPGNHIDPDLKEPTRSRRPTTTDHPPLDKDT